MTQVGSVNQILRVDHAGERGAISIYRAQLLVSRALNRKCVPALEEMLEHERRHHQAFESLLKARGVRHCYAISFWALGGFVLGTFRPGLRGCAAPAGSRLKPLARLALPHSFHSLGAGEFKRLAA